jgi:hypothetical protein
MPVELAVIACGALGGRVVDADGRPVAGATVFRSPQREPRAHSGSDGVFLLQGLPVGEVPIRIHVEGRAGWAGDVEISFGKTTEIGEVRIP